MPSLPQRLEASFSEEMRKRGEAYYHAGKVEIEHGDTDSVQAQVQGTQAYLVELNAQDSILNAYCDCLYFIDQGKFCKHVWAALLASRGQGHLSSIGNADGLELARDVDPIQDNHTDHWKEHVQLIARTASVSSAAAISRLNRPIYVISLEDSLQADCIVVQVAKQDRRYSSERCPYFYALSKYNQLNLDQDDTAIRSLLVPKC